MLMLMQCSWLICKLTLGVLHPLCALRPNIASWPPAMADRRHYRGGAGHHTPIERAGTTTRDSGSYGDQDARGSDAREGRKRESQGHRRRGELRRGRALSGERLGPLGRLTCVKKSCPSARKQMRSSERWKKALGCGKMSGTRWRKLGELRWRAVVRCAWSGGRRAREEVGRRARSGGESGECAGAVHGRRGWSWRQRARMPATRCRWPDTVGRARRGRVRVRGGGGRWTRARGRPARLRWLGRLVGAGPPMNNPLQSFLKVGVKRRNVPYKVLYNFALRFKFKFQTEFELQIKTSSRFLNKFILGIFV